MEVSQATDVMNLCPESGHNRPDDGIFTNSVTLNLLPQNFNQINLIEEFCKSPNDESHQIIDDELDANHTLVSNSPQINDQMLCQHTSVATEYQTYDDINHHEESEDADEVFNERNHHYIIRHEPLCSCSSDEEINELNSIMGLNHADRMKQLEEEQDQLNGSLMALTSHFAQVQLRLKQIVDVGSAEEREDLLKELEQFAFRGIPDIRHPNIDLNDEPADACVTTEDKLEQQRLKQKELIDKLKDQLEDLEKYAYETGDISAIPSSMLLERQTVIIEQLKGKLPINLDEIDKLTPEDLRCAVDKAIRDLVNPVIMKEQLVGQLKTQITDLERFITFLQGTNGENSSDCTCNCPTHGNCQQSVSKYDPLEAEEQKRKHHQRQKNFGNNESNETAIRMIRRALTILQVFAMTQFGCGNINGHFERNILKKTSKGNHWGDLRARLEVAIDHILEIHHEKCSNDSDYTSDSDDASGHKLIINEKMTASVRKQFSTALKDLLQHGLIGNVTVGDMMNATPSVFNWGCFSVKSQNVLRSLHAWDVILRYYELKNGYLYNASPARKLSQSFNLQIVGGIAITNKQTLLSCIDDIIETHTKLKRSNDSHFKAFICTALNEKKLVPWLRLIVKSRSIIDTYYQPWSYVSSTGFDDALRSLDRLSSIKFHLPCDLAVRQLQNIHDAF